MEQNEVKETVNQSINPNIKIHAPSNRTSNIINGIIAIASIGAVIVSSKALEKSNEAIELTRQTIKSSDSTNTISLNLAKETAEAYKITAEANKATAFAEKENVGLSRKLLNEQIVQSKQAKEQFKFENEPNLKVEKIKISADTLLGRIKIDVSLKSTTMSLISIDSSFFNIYTTKQNTDSIYRDLTNRNIDHNVPKRNQTRRRLNVSEIIPIKYSLYKDSFSLNDLKNIFSNREKIFLLGDVYFKNPFSKYPRCFTFGLIFTHLVLLHATEECSFEAIPLYEINLDCLKKKHLFLPEFNN